MTAKIAKRKEPANQQGALKRRIRRFYRLLNQREFLRCYEMIDPCVRNKPSSVTLLQYENALRAFIDAVGTFEPVEISIELHLDEPSKLYEGRDFAVGKTVWTDENGDQRVFAERWVREVKGWYTRSTGFVVPAIN